MDFVAKPVAHITCGQCGHGMPGSQVPPLSIVPCPACGKNLEAPGIIDDFLLLKRIGFGGTGVVYKGKDQSLDRPVAVKLLKREGEEEQQMQRWVGEARTLAQINHPSIVQIYRIGEFKGQFYLVMELVTGGSAKRYIEPGKQLSEAAALDLGIDVAQGLEAAYRVGIVHMDVKPGNLLLDKRQKAKLIDFGSSQFRHRHDEVGVVGTPYYIAPETALRQSPDDKSDMYSLGATLFHVLAGRAPFEAKRSREVIAMRLKSPAPSILDFRDDLHPKTAEVIARLLEFKPEMRYESYGELVDELKLARAALEGGDGQAGDLDRMGEASGKKRPSGAAKRGDAADEKPHKSSKSAAITAFAALLLLAFSLTAWWFIAGGADAPADSDRAPSGPAQGPSVDAPAVLELTENAQGDALLDDFEKSEYQRWRTEGAAFTRGPTTRQQLPADLKSLEFEGDSLAVSLSPHAAAGGPNDQALTGQLTSAPFPINHGYIHFLIGGGQDKDLELRLLIDGEVVASATGDDQHRLRYEKFDVRHLLGSEARLRMVDRSTASPLGYIAVDEIILSNAMSLDRFAKYRRDEPRQSTLADASAGKPDASPGGAPSAAKSPEPDKAGTPPTKKPAPAAPPAKDPVKPPTPAKGPAKSAPPLDQGRLRIGQVLSEVWSGESIKNLNLPGDVEPWKHLASKAPSSSTFVSQLSESADSAGVGGPWIQRVSGYIRLEQGGTRTFILEAVERAWLFVSPDHTSGHMRQIAAVHAKQASKSANFNLKKGQWHYFELWRVRGEKKADLSVKWKANNRGHASDIDVHQLAALPPEDLPRNVLNFWYVPEKVQARAARNRTKMNVGRDGVIEVSGENADWDYYQVTLCTAAQAITGMRLEAMPWSGSSGPPQGPGRSQSGDFALHFVHVSAGSEGPVELSSVRASHSDGEHEAGHMLADDDRRWSVGKEGVHKSHWADFVFSQPLYTPPGGEMTCLNVTLVFRGPKQHALGRFRLLLTTAPDPAGISSPPLIEPPAVDTFTFVPLAPENAQSSSASTTLNVLEDHSVLTAGPWQRGETYTIQTRPIARPITALRLLALPDPSLPNAGPGRAPLGRFAISRVAVEVLKGKNAKSKPVDFKEASVDWEQGGNRAANLIDGQSNTQWVSPRDPGAERIATFVLASPLAVPADGRLEISMEQARGLGRFRWLATSCDDPAVWQTPESQPVGQRRRESFSLSLNFGDEDAQGPDPEGGRSPAIWAKAHPYAPGSHGYVGGRVKSPAQKKDPLFSSAVEDASGLRFTVPNGRYEVTLLFADHWKKKKGERVFDVTIEGEKVAEFDILDGYKVGQTRSLTETVEVADHVLDIGLSRKKDKPIVNAIYIRQKD